MKLRLCHLKGPTLTFFAMVVVPHLTSARDASTKGQKSSETIKILVKNLVVPESTI